MIPVNTFHSFYLGWGLILTLTKAYGFQTSLAFSTWKSFGAQRLCWRPLLLWIGTHKMPWVCQPDSSPIFRSATRRLSIGALFRSGTSGTQKKMVRLRELKALTWAVRHDLGIHKPIPDQVQPRTRDATSDFPAMWMMTPEGFFFHSSPFITIINHYSPLLSY